jgi:hypothetical protein
MRVNYKSIELPDKGILICRQNTAVEEICVIELKHPLEARSYFNIPIEDLPYLFQIVGETIIDLGMGLPERM